MTIPIQHLPDNIANNKDTEEQYTLLKEIARRSMVDRNPLTINGVLLPSDREDCTTTPLPSSLYCTFECEMEDTYGKFAEWHDGLVTQRKHSQDILDKLEEARKNKHLFLEQTGIDMKALAENGFDANSGCIVSLLRTHLTPVSNEEIEWLLMDSRALRYGMKLEAEHNNHRMYSVDKQVFMNVKQNIPTHIGQWRLMFINSKDGVVFYKQFLDNNK